MAIKIYIDRNTNYRKPSTKWTPLNLDFTESNYGNKLVYDQIVTALADMCFRNIMKTQSVY